jgi:hypothetical protein
MCFDAPSLHTRHEVTLFDKPIKPNYYLLMADFSDVPCFIIEDACGGSSPHPCTVEFKAEVIADHCQTTAEQRALWEEWCNDFCL